MLGVLPGSSATTIASAYRRLALQHHPDKCRGRGEVEVARSEEAFRRITDAYRRASSMAVTASHGPSEAALGTPPPRVPRRCRQASCSGMQRPTQRRNAAVRFGSTPPSATPPKAPKPSLLVPSVLSGEGPSKGGLSLFIRLGDMVDPELRPQDKSRAGYGRQPWHFDFAGIDPGLPRRL